VAVRDVTPSNREVLHGRSATVREDRLGRPPTRCPPDRTPRSGRSGAAGWWAGAGPRADPQRATPVCARGEWKVCSACPGTSPVRARGGGTTVRRGRDPLGRGRPLFSAPGIAKAAGSVPGPAPPEAEFW